MDMQRENTPNTLDEMLLALADGELDFRDQPEVLALIAEDPKAAHRLAAQQRLRAACAKVMDGPEMKCPDALAGELLAMASRPAQPAAAKPAPLPFTDPSVIARIGRWAPSAVAAVLLLAAGVLFTQTLATGSGINTQAASFLSTDQIQGFTGRHYDCAEKPDRLKQASQFGSVADFEKLPGKLSSYFKTSTDGMQLNLNGIGYDYQLTGSCSLPGSGAVHIVYRKHTDPSRSISVWIIPAKPEHDVLEQKRVYTEVGNDLLRPVIFWRDAGLLYYLVGDSIQDCDKAVQHLRQAV